VVVQVIGVGFVVNVIAGTFAPYAIAAGLAAVTVAFAGLIAKVFDALEPFTFAVPA
jgi:hypothetical protein